MKTESWIERPLRQARNTALVQLVAALCIGFPLCHDAFVFWANRGGPELEEELWFEWPLGVFFVIIFFTTSYGLLLSWRQIRILRSDMSAEGHASSVDHHCDEDADA